MVEAPMGMTHQVAVRNIYSNFCYCHILSKKIVSSGRANAFMNSDRNWKDGTSIFDEIVIMFDFIKYRWTMCVCKKISGSPIKLFGYVCGWHTAHWKGSPDITLSQWCAYHKSFHEKTWVKHPIFLASIGIEVSECWACLNLGTSNLCWRSSSWMGVKEFTSHIFNVPSLMWFMP